MKITRKSSLIAYLRARLGGQSDLLFVPFYDDARAARDKTALRVIRISRGQIGAPDAEKGSPTRRILSSFIPRR